MCLAEVLTAVLGDVLVIDHEPFTSASEKGTFPNQCPSFGRYPVNTLLWLLHIPVGCSPNPSSRFPVLTQLVLWRDPETSLGCAGNICDPRLHLFVCLFIPLSKSSKLERSRLHYENQESFAKNSTLTFLLACTYSMVLFLSTSLWSTVLAPCTDNCASQPGKDSVIHGTSLRAMEWSRGRGREELGTGTVFCTHLFYTHVFF